MNEQLNLFFLLINSLSISFVNRPLPPMADNGWSVTLSPVVLIFIISAFNNNFLLHKLAITREDCL